jgi:hypothetical protein
VIAAGLVVAAALTFAGAGAPVPGGFTPSDPRIDEASGMVVSQSHPDTVWILNDSGDSARLFAVSTTDGHTEGVVTLTGARNVDWEALAISPGTPQAQLWVGDVGDNDSVRGSVQVYRLPEPAQVSGAVADWTRFDLQYPDGAHDAETLLVDPSTQRLYVVTKGLLGGAVYEAPPQLQTERTNQLTKIGSAPLLITDGAYRSDGSVVLRSYLSGFVRSDVTASSRPFPLPRQRQAESLAVIGDGREAYVGSEGAGTAVLRVTLPPLQRRSPGATTPPATVAAPDAREGSGQRALAIGLTVVVLVTLSVVAWAVGRRRRGRQP